MGGKVECFAFVIELADLKGREVLDGYRVETLTKF
jgi:adenine phosphoribosyltransferase